MKTQVVKIYFSIALMVFAVVSCSSISNPENVEDLNDSHTAQNALDWSGTYSGNLPCADCEYIETNLTLKEDLTYILTTLHVGKDSKTDTLKGTFSWEGNNVKLGGINKNERPNTFKVEENKVRQLDVAGKPVTGALAQNYVMHKTGNQTIENKKWQLVALNGKPIDGSAETHYIIFHSEDGRLEAKVGCNMLLETYTIKNELQVKIEHGISTMMACPDNIEQSFLEVLVLADNLSTDGKTLSLNKARMAPLARFTLVAE